MSTVTKTSPTVAVYDRIAPNYIARTIGADMSRFHDDVQCRILPGAHLLDVGAGSGRDALALTQCGYLVDLLEPSDGLRTAFVKAHHLHSGVIIPLPVEEFTMSPTTYDGIYACASMLHVPANKWQTALVNLRQAIKPNGLLFISVKQGESYVDAEGREFTGFNDCAHLVSVVETNKQWRCASSAASTDSLGRDTAWLEAWFQAI